MLNVCVVVLAFACCVVCCCGLMCVAMARCTRDEQSPSMMDNFFKKMNFRKLSRERRKEAVTKLSRELHLNGITAVPVQRWPNVVLAHDDSKPTPEEIIINRLGFIFLVCISIIT